MTVRSSVPVTIEIHPYLRDHRFQTDTVYPAVEALQTLADLLFELHPELDIRSSCSAEFKRFLPLPAESDSIGATIDLAVHAHGELSAALCTVLRGRTSGINRTVEHVRAAFGCAPVAERLPLDLACALKGLCMRIPAARVYQDMVAFGPAFQHLDGTILLSTEGAASYLISRQYGAGSSLALDAAFQLACVWTQCFHGKTMIPTGYGRRSILKVIVPNQRCYCRAVPKRVESAALYFDLWIYDSAGDLAETALDVRMEDVFRGRMRPPADVMATTGAADPAQVLGPHCLGLAVVELETITPFARLAFTPREIEIESTLGPRRKISFTGARIALKRLARMLAENVEPLDPTGIETLGADKSHPHCDVPGSSRRLYCSAAHDNRFAAAAAAETRIGIDVERSSDKLLKSQRLFVSDAEKRLIENTPLERVQSCLRIWTAKEAAAKALDTTLADSWNRVELTQIGKDRSLALIDGRTVAVHHCGVNDHLFTLLTLAGSW